MKRLDVKVDVKIDLAKVILAIASLLLLYLR